MPDLVRVAFGAAVISAVFLSLRAQRQAALSPAERAAARAQAGDLSEDMQLIRRIFPSAALITEERKGLYAVFDQAGGMLGRAVYGPPAGSGITGYAGEVPFVVGLDPGHRIKGVLLLPGGETPRYAAAVSERLRDAWTGLEPAEAAVEPVNAVTGATATSTALVEGVRAVMSEVAEQHTDYTRGTELVTRRSFADMAVLGFLAASLACFIFRLSSPRLRTVWGFLSVAVPGFLAASMLSLALFGGWLRGYFSWDRHWLSAVLAAAALGVALVSGKNYYCYYFCPFGSAQELAGKLGLRKLSPGKKLGRILRIIRVLGLLGALAAVLSGAGVPLQFFEPFAAFRWAYAPLSARVLALVFLLLSFKVRRPWCRLCPTGGLIDGLRIRRRPAAGRAA